MKFLKKKLNHPIFFFFFKTNILIFVVWIVEPALGEMPKLFFIFTVKMRITFSELLSYFLNVDKDSDHTSTTLYQKIIHYDPQNYLHSYKKPELIYTWDIHDWSDKFAVCSLWKRTSNKVLREASKQFLGKSPYIWNIDKIKWKQHGRS